MNEPNDQSEKPTLDASSKQAERRRLLIGASAIVPAILTAKPRSALACTCFSPSASASIDLAHSRLDREDDGECAGRTPDYWRKYSNLPYAASKTVFGNVFMGGPNVTMKDVITTQTNYKKKTTEYPRFERYLAAAWCNLKARSVSDRVLSLSDLQAMWSGRYGSYSPVPGAPPWGEAAIIEYLDTTMQWR